VLRWSQATWRKLEALRDRIMRGIGSEEPWFMEEMTDDIGERAVAVHWRKPLRIDEVNRLAPTPEVRKRQGRA
jgi:hypothetical protein